MSDAIISKLTPQGLDASERWKPVPDVPAYQVSDNGKVRRLLPSGETKELKVRYLPAGYAYVDLRREGRVIRKYVHRLVMEAFVGERPGRVVCHNDGDQRNNRLENLRYDTQAGNLADRLRHGTMKCGESKSDARLSKKQVFAIRCMCAAGLPQHDVAERFGVTQQHVSKIAGGTARRLG